MTATERSGQPAGFDHRLIPDDVIGICRRLQAAGHEAHLVGGGVRDLVLGRPPKDFDLATSAHPDAVMALFGNRFAIPTGLQHGTVTVLAGTAPGRPVEVTTFRGEGVYLDGRRPSSVEVGKTLIEDLARRDFTMNAIAYRPRTDELRDPFEGRADIERRLVRAVGNADERMTEDRLRALRAIRFASRYGFSIEPQTLAAISHSAPFLTRLSHERVQQELVKTMEQVHRPSQALRLWRDLGALAVLVPVLASLDEVALDTLDELPRAGAGGMTRPQRTSNRMAALFLDVPAFEARRTLTALRFSKHETSWVGALVERWQTVGAEMGVSLREGTAPDHQVRRWLARIGRTYAGAFLRVAMARWSAMSRAGQPTPDAAAVRSLHRAMRRSLFRDPIELADLQVTGNDLRRAGIPAGPIYAKILHALLERVLEEPARNTPAALLGEVPAIVAALGGGVGNGVQPESEL
jgi:tRNA nucleotidyltransferase (CCA-adding enzyme)